MGCRKVPVDTTAFRDPSVLSSGPSSRPHPDRRSGAPLDPFGEGGRDGRKGPHSSPGSSPSTTPRGAGTGRREDPGKGTEPVPQPQPPRVASTRTGNSTFRESPLDPGLLRLTPATGFEVRLPFRGDGRSPETGLTGTRLQDFPTDTPSHFRCKLSRLKGDAQSWVTRVTPRVRTGTL